MKPDCVILAAGLSSRMGRNKMVMEIGGLTVIENCLRPFYENCRNIIVVTGKYQKDMEFCLKDYSKVRIVHNKDYIDGMFSSVKLGIRHVESNRFFLTPGDYPFVQRETILKMAENKGFFVSPVFGRRHGHPILLDKQFIPIILNSNAQSLRDCLAQSEIKPTEVFVEDSGILTDIDTMAQFKKHS